MPPIRRLGEGDAAAIALYRRLGFAEYGREPHARKTDEAYQDVVLMWLSLRPGNR